MPMRPLPPPPTPCYPAARAGYLHFVRSVPSSDASPPAVEIAASSSDAWLSCSSFLFSSDETAAMRLKIRLRGGLVLGTLIPCAALFYFFRLCLRCKLPPFRRIHSGGIFSRGANVARVDDNPYYVGLKRCAEDPYHANSNPNGILQLGLAENWRVAEFMGKIMQGPATFDPSLIVLTAGATPPVEILSFCLADPASAFLVPSPYYPGWDRDIQWRTGVVLIPVPCRSTDNFNISIPALERAYIEAKTEQVKIRAVLVSNPCNPVGTLINKETLYDLLDFVTAKNIHLISDEIFAGSTYGSNKFVSVAEFLHAENFDRSRVRSRVHIVYGLSIDLSVPGFRVGVIYSCNENVLSAASKLARFSSISVPTQRLLVSMLSDNKFISEYLTINRDRVRTMHALFVDALKHLGIKCASSVAGLYCWADMSKCIGSYSEKGELKLWDKLINVAKVNVTPGSTCHCIEPGWFRLCFSTLEENDIPVVMERIRTIIESN